MPVEWEQRETQTFIVLRRGQLKTRHFVPNPGQQNKYIRLLNHKWQTAHVYNQSTSYTKYGPPAQHAG